MNIRAILSAALAATAFAFAPAQAQAPSAGSSIETFRLEAKIAAMQQQISALQSQVQQLQQQLRAGAPPSRMTGPVSQMPLPKFTVPNLTLPKTLPLVVPPPHSRDNSIPNYTATFIQQAAR